MAVARLVWEVGHHREALGRDNGGLRMQAGVRCIAARPALEGRHVGREGGRDAQVDVEGLDAQCRSRAAAGA